jgi:hypothetical protein
VAEIDPGSASVAFCGMGNIAGWIVTGDQRRGMVCLPGIVGHQRRSSKEFQYPFPPGSAVVLHSDGVSDKWALDRYPGLLSRSPVLIAATVLRDAGTRRDDACVLAAGWPA